MYQMNMNICSLMYRSYSKTQYNILYSLCIALKSIDLTICKLIQKQHDTERILYRYKYNR